jgi:endo-1,4-beta-D-glucanase Y
MSLSTKLFVSLALLVTIAAHSAVNYPYPQRKNYGNGTINATSSTASDNLKTKFKNFVRDFYVEGNCNGTNDCARIRFDPGQEQYTVSEGIGYAMIMMVYFSDATDSYQTHFDKLWAYYQKWTNSNGVMNWKINGFSSVEGQNGATDAEFDVAFALAMARYQFNDTKYSTAASNLILKIWEHEMESDGLHKPGDAWNSDKNPSYVSPAAFEIFKDLGNSTNWGNAITRNYTFLKANQNTSTGLPSGWANSDGSTKVCSNNCGISTINYDPDAVRAPWRWAWSNAWFGHADAKTLLTKLATWVNGKDAVDVKGPISLTGTMGTDGNSAYVGSLACALTHSSTYQSKLNSYWSTLNAIADNAYFNQAMRLLTGLLITGNMPNLKACAAGNCGTNMGGGGGFDGTGTSIDKFAAGESEDEEDRGFAATWEPWFAYTDKESNGSSTISNSKFQTKDENDNCKDIESYSVVMKDGNDWVAKIPQYSLVKGSNQYGPYVALGLSARNNGASAGKYYNFTQCTNGFSYKYKGVAHNFKVQTTPVDPTSGQDHYTPVEIASATEWKTQNVPFEDLSQPTWTGVVKVDFDPAKIYGFVWEIKADDDGLLPNPSALTGSLAIKDFKCLGNLNLPTSRPPLVCGGDDPPSTGRSSSSGSGTGNSSGSGGSGAGNSSSSGTNTPITISKIATANAVQLINNGVSLQVKNAATLEVFNIKGNSVRKMNFSSGVHSVNFSDLPKGLYIVRTKFGSHREVLYVPVK